MNHSKKNNVSAMCFTIALVLVIGVIVVSALIAQNENTRFDWKDSLYEVETVNVEGKGSMKVAELPVIHTNEVVRLTIAIPQNITDEDALMYTNNYTSAKAMVDGEEIGSYGCTMPLPYGRMLGNIRVVIPLKASYAGKELTLEITGMFTGVSPIGEPWFGHAKTMEYHILKSNIWRIGACSILVTVLILCLGISFYHLVYKRFTQSATYMSLFGFISCIILWMLCSSDLPQFMTNQNEVVSLTSFMALAFMAPFFMAYCHMTLTRGKRAFLITSCIGLLIPIANVITYVTNIANPVDLMYVTHVFIGGCIILAVVNCVRSMKAYSENRFIAAAIMVLGATAVVAFICFYQDQMGYSAALVMSIGLSLFVFCLFGMLLAREQRLITEATSDNMYKKLAFMDYLTGCGNRAAYERELEEAPTNNRKRVTLVMFDLNRLKTVNDELGHAAGDEMILGISDCISKAFAPEGHCYRLGGDEFATLLWDCEKKLEMLLEKFRLQMDFYNSEHVIPISVAIGLYTDDNPKERKGFDRIYSKADEAMYIDKLRCHEQMDKKKES